MHAIVVHRDLRQSGTKLAAVRKVAAGYNQLKKFTALP
jgi:hypothetical protein